MGIKFIHLYSNVLRYAPIVFCIMNSQNFTTLFKQFRFDYSHDRFEGKLFVGIGCDCNEIYVWVDIIGGGGKRPFNVMLWLCYGLNNG